MASSIIAVHTSLTASQGGYKRLGLITADKEDALTGKISEALKDVDAALIIAKPGVSRYDDLWDMINVLDNQKIKILGGIMA